MLLSLLLSCGQNAQIGSNEPSSYDLLTVEKSDFHTEEEYPASIKGRQDIRVIPRVDGYLRKINVTEGQKVTKGALLFVVDQTAYQADLKTAEANVALAQSNLDKANLDLTSKKILFEKNIVSEFDYRQCENDLHVAEANLNAANAQREAAATNLSYTELRSPSDGVVGSIPYRLGDYVGPSTTEGLTVVADNSTMYVYFSMTERKVMEYVSRYGGLENAVKALPEVRLRLADGSLAPQSGKVESISGVVDESTGSLSARASFQNPDGIILSGGTGSILMPQTLEGVIVIPQEATFEQLDKIYVYKVNDGKAESAIITISSYNDGKHYIVTDGLEEGDVIIASGAKLVREGETVKAE